MIVFVILYHFLLLERDLNVYEGLEISTSLASGLARRTGRDCFLWDHIFRKYSRKALRFFGMKRDKYVHLTLHFFTSLISKGCKLT
jgi:hypothetical protein